MSAKVHVVQMFPSLPLGARKSTSLRFDPKFMLALKMPAETHPSARNARADIHAGKGETIEIDL
jgi:hypothetical protein